VVAGALQGLGVRVVQELVDKGHVKVGIIL
jgi:hypothetical protein